MPGDLRGGMDNTLMTAGMAAGAFAALREAAAHLPEGTIHGSDPEAGSWDAVEVRHVWGDHSMAAMVYAMHKMRAEVEKEGKAGTARLRNVTFARVEGGNHIVSPSRDGFICCGFVLVLRLIIGACPLDALGPSRTHPRRSSSRIIHLCVSASADS